MRLLIPLFVIFLLNASPMVATPTQQVPHKLKKQLQIITTEWKTYRISPSESISLYGAKRRKFISSSLYWGEAGYGALTGIRSGYLEGGVFLGYMYAPQLFDSITERLFVDYRVFMGAGGGGDAPQGGGLIIHPTIGLGTTLSYKTRVFLEIGYMHFLNGNISSPTIAININFLTRNISTTTKKGAL